MLGWGGGRGRGLRSRNDFYMCGAVGGYGTKKCFRVAVWEREDFIFYFLNTLTCVRAARRGDLRVSVAAVQR